MMLSDTGQPAPRPAAAWFAVAACLVTAGLLLRGAAVDHGLFLGLNGLAPAWAVPASALSVLGLGVAVFVLVGLAGVQRPPLAASVLVVLLAGGLVVQVLKWAVGAPRPVVVLGPDAMHVVGIALHARSMPSGHASLMAALLAMAWQAPASLARPLLRRAVVVVLSLCTVAAALSRVVVGAHWPSDVLVGCGVGIVAGTLLVGTSTGRAVVATVAVWLSGKAGSRAMAAALVAAAASLWVARGDYPLVTDLYGGLAGSGLLAAWAWWRLHPGPAMTRSLAGRWRRTSPRS